MAKTTILSILLALTTIESFCQISFIVNGSVSSQSESIFIKAEDKIMLNWNNKNDSGHWAEIKPILKQYDNYKNENPFYIESVEYQVIDLKNDDRELMLDNRLRVRYFAYILVGDTFLQKENILTEKPIHWIPDYNIVQIVTRKDDSYLGYLTELLNTPFILPPAFLSGIGHQTDLRIGADCAELAIYGKRRQGYKIPYCGPGGIKNYMDEINKNEVFEGCIIHFGFQVCVLYQDNGAKGVLDKDDLLIQSYDPRAQICTYLNSGFYNFNYKAYKWKEKYE